VTAPSWSSVGEGGERLEHVGRPRLRVDPVDAVSDNDAAGVAFGAKCRPQRLRPEAGWWHRRGELLERETGAAEQLVVANLLRRPLTGPNDSPWLTVEQTAELLRTSPGAIRQRISTGWLAGDTVRDGKRRFIRREAVLRELEQNARRRMTRTGE
jgi:hypothetical protein